MTFYVFLDACGHLSLDTEAQSGFAVWLMAVLIETICQLVQLWQQLFLSLDPRHQLWREKLSRAVWLGVCQCQAPHLRLQLWVASVFFIYFVPILRFKIIPIPVALFLSIFIKGDLTLIKTKDKIKDKAALVTVSSIKECKRVLEGIWKKLF